MLLFGHIGPAAFLAQRLRLPVLATMFFAILPDLVDKPLYVVGLAPAARWIAHTVLFLVVVSAALHLLGRRQLALTAFFGIASHYVLDLRFFLPLFYPFVQYEWPTAYLGPALDSIALLFEAFGLIFIIMAADDLQRELSVITFNIKKLGRKGK